MSLNFRQRILYTYVVSLYKPQGLQDVSKPFTQNPQLQYVPAYKNVFCYYKPTPELDVNALAGRGKELNLFTLDEFHFSSDQPIADDWVIQLTGSDPKATPHPYIGRLWICRDNSQMAASQGRRNNGFQMVYAMLANIPGLSQKVKGLD